MGVTRIVLMPLWIALISIAIETMSICFAPIPRRIISMSSHFIDKLTATTSEA
jgi:hypothetical protein